MIDQETLEHSEIICFIFSIQALARFCLDSWLPTTDDRGFFPLTEGKGGGGAKGGSDK